MTEYDKWEASRSEFMGYVKGKLEDIQNDIKDIKKDACDSKDRMNKAENSITELKVKSGLIGGISGFVGGLVGGFFKF